MMMEYAVVFEWAGENYSAYVPDLPGCVSSGKTLALVREGIKEAIAGHLAILAETGEPIPEPRTKVGTVEVAA